MDDALYRASIASLDLVQIAFKDGVPVCSIMDYGKHKYQQHKKQLEAKKKQPKHIVKEIQLTPRIDKHDADIKMRKIIDFINDGCTVRVSMSFRGRENSYKEIGIKIMDSFRTIPGTSVTEYNSTGNQISFIVSKGA